MESTPLNRPFKTAFSLALLHAFLWAALSVQYFQVENQPPSFYGGLFAVLFTLGHFFTFSLVLFIPTALILRLIKRRRLAEALVGALGVAATGTLIVDLIVFTLFKAHLSPSLIGIFLAASPFEIYDPPASFYVTVLAGFLGLCLAEFFLTRLAEKPVLQRFNLSAGLTLLAALVIFNMAHAVAVVKSYPPVLARVGALPYTFPLSAQKFLKKMGVKPVTSPSDWGREVVGAGLDYPKKPVAIAPPEKPLNIIVILIDGWRPDSFNETVMPRLTAWSRKALVFNDHFSGGNATRCGVFSLFYGLPATYFHTFNSTRREPVLTEKLKESGYQFGIFAAASLEAVDIAQTSFVGLAKDDIHRASGQNNPERDADMERQFLEYLDQRDPDRPTFGFMFYDLLHGHKPFPDLPHPFSPVKPWNYLEFNNDVDPTPYLNMYNNAAYTLDIHLAAMLDELEKRGLFENSLIIITSDHGEEVNDTRTNSWSHNNNFTRYQIEVPFMMFWPGREPRAFDYRTRHYDLVPTLLEEVLGAGAEAAPDYSLGFNLFTPGDRDLTICASYSDSAILYQENAFVLKKYGRLKSYGLDGSDAGAQLPPDILKRAMDEMRLFYK